MSSKRESEFGGMGGQGLVLALDPGNTQTGWVSVEPDESEMGHMQVSGFGNADNTAIRHEMHRLRAYHKSMLMLIEVPKPRGQPTASEEMETLIEIGRFLQMWSGPYSYVFRQPTKIHICGTSKATDANVRQALVDRFGGQTLAVGGKRCKKCGGKGVTGRARCPSCKLSTSAGNACGRCNGGKNKVVYRKAECPECNGTTWETAPGPLYGCSTHVWAALAIACAWLDGGREKLHEIAGKQPTKKKKRRKE